MAEHVKIYFSFASESNVGQIAHLHMVTQGSRPFSPLTLQKINVEDCALMRRVLLLPTSVGSVLIPGSNPMSLLSAQEEKGETEIGDHWPPLDREGHYARQVLGGHGRT